MDFLSYLTLKQTDDSAICINAPCDHLIMNSISNLKKTLTYLQKYTYIHCYLDNDLAGQKTVETVAGMYDGRVYNESNRYAGYKDLNDYLRGKKQWTTHSLSSPSRRAFFIPQLFLLSYVKSYLNMIL